MYQELLTTKDVMRIYKISIATINRMIKDGRLPVIRIGSSLRFDPRALGLVKIEQSPAPPKPPIEEPKKGETVLESIMPEIEKAFQHIPQFGEIGFRVAFHDSRPVRIEYNPVISLMLEPRIKEEPPKQKVRKVGRPPLRRR